MKTKASQNTSAPATMPSVNAKMTRFDFAVLILIVVVYATIAFTRLGYMHAPHTSYSFTEQGDVLLDLGEEKAVGGIWNYLGHQNNPKYNLWYWDGREWIAVFCDAVYEDGTIDSSGCWDAGSVFCWNYCNLGITAQYLYISASADNYADSILELVLTDSEGQTITPINSQQYEALFDEQDEFEGRSSAMNGTYFDEIYHGRTAYEMINHLVCCENVHPPLGKEIIAIGVLLFGMNPFGWRFMGTLSGVLMIPVIYLFAKRFFKETWISVAAALLFAFDFMHFVQTRIATIDVFVTFFIMLAYYFMYCYLQTSFYEEKLSKTFVPLGLCGIAMGLSWACKWTGIYASIGLCILFFAQMLKRYLEYRHAVLHARGTKKYIYNNFKPLFWKTIGFCCIFFVAIPAAIYILSYIPFVDGTDRSLLVKVIEAQKTMFSYHNALEADHPFGSTWYQWPIMYRPTWYYSGAIGDLREGISAFGNPLVWWVGIPAAVYMLHLSVRRRDKKATFLLVGYLSQYAPWSLIKRVVFIYHYFPSVPFVVMMITYTMYRLASAKEGKWKKQVQTGIWLYVILAIGLFALFYPVLSGLPIHPEYAEKYLKWFDSWVLLDTWS